MSAPLNRSSAQAADFSNKMALFIMVCFCLSLQVQAFTGPAVKHRYWGLSPVVLRSSSSDSAKDETKAESTEETIEEAGDTASEMLDAFADLLSQENRTREDLKQSLLQLGASYDRGFGASTTARNNMQQVLSGLESLNPQDYAARGITGNETSPLEGSWRMVWTDAQDVLVLGASPVVTVGAIYQVFAPPLVTNIIDLIPRAQALLPPSFPATLFRAEVTTRASARPNNPNRVGLDFEKVQLKPVEILGQEVGDTLPPLGFDLPKINIPGGDPETSPGYFDVTYLDEELLIIRQNAPGGMFALVKVEANDP